MKFETSSVLLADSATSVVGRKTSYELNPCGTPRMSKSTVLIIEDERPLVEVLTYNLKNEGYEVHSANDGQEGLRRAFSIVPDMILLDLMLPVIEGLEVCRQLRTDPRTKDIPILMLTAKTDEVDEVIGFRMGADDYVAKPFKIKPLIHRIQALLRRPRNSETPTDIVSRNGIEIDRIHHKVKLDGEELLLTPTEFRLLWTLIRQPGRTFSRNELMDSSRGEDANSLERTIDVHIRSLRLKLRDRAPFVETVRGIGYRFREEAEAPSTAS